MKTKSSVNPCVPKWNPRSPRGCQGPGVTRLPALTGSAWASGQQLTEGLQLRVFDNFLCGGAFLPPLVKLGALGELPPAPGTQLLSQSSGELSSLGAPLAPAAQLKCTYPQDALRLAKFTEHSECSQLPWCKQNCRNKHSRHFFCYLRTPGKPLPLTTTICLKKVVESKWINTS